VRARSLVAALFALPAAAQVGRAESRIFWTAPAGCPDQAEVVREVERFLRQPLAEARVPETSIEGRVSSLGASYRLVLDFSTRGVRRQRQLEHDDCAKLTEAAALVMAMAIDPERMKLAETDSPLPQASALPPPAPSSAPPVEPVRSAESRAVVWSARVTGLAQAGALPGIGPGIRGTLALEPLPSLRFEGGGGYWFATSESLVRGARADFRMWSAVVRACSVHDVRWELGLCAGPEVGQMTGTGQGLQARTTATDWWGAFMIGLWGGPGLGRRLDLVVGIEAGASLVRPRFGVEGLGQVFRPAPWVGRAGLGVKFP
jgi:hypothetical protein